MSLQQVVYLVDGNEQVRTDIARILGSQGLTVRSFEGGERFFRECRPLMRGCVVLDLRLPDINGTDLLQRLKEMGARLPAVVMTRHADLRAAVRAVQLGALDVIEKPISSPSFLVDRVREALARDEARILEEERRASLLEPFKKLTNREHEVLGLVVEGMSTKQIAGKLGVSAKTIEVHRTHIMKKLAARSVVDVVRMTAHSQAVTGQP